MQAAREVVRLAELLQRNLSDARHDAHVQHDVTAVGNLDTDFRIRRSGRAHQERHHEHGAPLHRPLEERCQPGARVFGRQPVVRGPRIFLVRGAHEGEMFSARHVVRGASMQVAAGEFLLVQLDQLARREALGNQAIPLALRTVAEHHGRGRGQGFDVGHPRSDGRIHCPNPTAEDSGW